jgi:4-amino-4-deoxy-L-arabinose transferase-like glycosyltransferase
LAGVFLRLLPLIAVALLIYATTLGLVVVGPDSVIYLDAAERIRDGSYSAFQYGSVEPVKHYPPLYSAILSLFASPHQAARWFHVLLYAASIASIGFITFRLTQHRWVAFAASIVFATSAIVFQMYSMVMTEALFLLIVMWALYGLSVYERTGSRYVLAGTALLCALAALTRYPGIVLVGAGTLWLLRKRWTHALLFALLAVLPIVAWAASHGTDRSFALHLPAWEEGYQLVQSVSRWVVPGDGELAGIRALLAAGVAFLVFLHARAGWQQPLVRITALFATLYFAFLVVSITFFDAQTRLTPRHVLPLFLAALFICAARPHRVTAAIVALIVVFSVRTTFTYARILHVYGYGYGSLAYQQIGQALTFPIAYSNAPEAVYFLTRQTPRQIPATFDRWTERRNLHYQSEIRKMQAAVQGGGAVVYFERVPRRYVPSINDMLKLGIPLKQWKPVPWAPAIWVTAIPPQRG